MNVANDHDEAAEGEAAWLWPLYALLALVASIFNQITRLKRVRPTTRFKPNWRDNWQGLRESEWLRDQVIAHGLACLLAGRELDLDAPLIFDVPADYGGPCPRTPFAMNQRFLALAKWAANPEAIIRERYKRLVKAFGRNPLSFDRATDAASLTPAFHAASNAEPCLALILNSAQNLRPHHDDALANARGPPRQPRQAIRPTSGPCR